MYVIECKTTRSCYSLHWILVFFEKPDEIAVLLRVGLGCL